MAAWRPVKRREFIRKLRVLGFAGPYRGTRHEFLVFGNHRQTVPSNAEYSVHQLKMLIQQLQQTLGRKISLGEWERL